MGKAHIVKMHIFCWKQSPLGRKNKIAFKDRTFEIVLGREGCL